MDVKKSADEEITPLKREMDSLDDFEHLGHDSSPLVEIKGGVGAPQGLKIDVQAPASVLTDIINNQGESVGSSITGSFDQLKDLDQPLVPQKMDSNIKQMGDIFPDRKIADDKLNNFMQGITSEAKQIGVGQDKYNIQSFMDSERNVSQETPKPKSNNDILDRYSDSEPDEDEFVRSKFENIPEKTKDSDFYEPEEHFKSERFRDSFDVKPKLPTKDYHTEQLVDIAPQPPIPISTVKQTAPEIVKTTPEPINVPELFKAVPEPVKVASEPIKAIPEPVKVPEPIKASPEPIREKTPEPAKDATGSKQEIPKQIVEEKKVVPIKTKIAPADAEAIFRKMGLDTWFNPERLNPKVESLIYWRDPKKSGPVFGGVLLILLALTYFSLISVVAYLSLFALTGTIAFRIYKNIVQAVQKTGDGHPFKELLQLDVSLPQNKVKEVSEVGVAHLNAAVVELRRLFLVEDLVDSIKFGVLLWTLTYLGAWFNGMSLIIIAWVALFTLPKVYEANKSQIDANLEIVRTKLADITSKVRAAIPIGKKSEEKKEQ